MTPRELFDLVVAAERPSRELDLEIWRLSGCMPGGLEDFGLYDDPAMGCGEGETHAAPSYTGSLDAKLPVERDGLYWMISGPHQSARNARRTEWTARVAWRKDGRNCHAEGFGETEILARRAAALLAMAQR